LSQASRNRFTFSNAANNIDSSDESTPSKNKIEIYLLFKILFVKIQDIFKKLKRLIQVAKDQGVAKASSYLGILNGP
jgi:hypothetical protein